jgi:hypothetical protein
MWSSKKSWWAKKAEENKGSNTHRKNWCVIKVAVGCKPDASLWIPVVIFKYKAVAKLNAPMMYGSDGKISKAIEVDNLTKHEAHCVAKGLNFLDGETT